MPTKSTTSVEYREISGFPGYRVGDDGTVWTLWVCVNDPKTRRVTHVLGDEWKQRRLGRAGRGLGHLAVSLWRNGKGYSRYVHRIVLEAFVGPCPKGMQCRHFPDRDTANNRLDNLQWGTAKENGADRIFHGTSGKGVSMTPSRLAKHMVVCQSPERNEKIAVSKRGKPRPDFADRNRNRSHEERVRIALLTHTPEMRAKLSTSLKGRVFSDEHRANLSASKRNASDYMIQHGGRFLHAREWAGIVGVAEQTIRERLRSGWSVERALTTPSRKRARMCAD